MLRGEEIGPNGLSFLYGELTFRIDELLPVQIPLVLAAHIDKDPLRRDLHDLRLYTLARFNPAAIRLAFAQQFGKALLFAFRFQILMIFFHGHPHANKMCGILPSSESPVKGKSEE
jgi:hypothetical protein